MKQRRNILMLAALLIVLIVLYAAVSTWQQGVKEREAKQAEESVIYLTDAGEISKISYTDGESSMDFVKDEDGSWYYEGDPEIPIQQSSVKEVEESVEELTAVRELEEPDALADYGLDDPAYTLWYTDETGTVPIYIGDMSGENYYAAVGEEKEQVYTVSGDLASFLIFDLEDFVEDDSVPQIGSEALKKVTVKQGGNITEFTEENELLELAGGFGALALSDLADCHATADELSGYGLDEAGRIEVSAVYEDSSSQEETKFTIYVGNTDDTGESRYVTVENSVLVYLVSGETLENIMTVEETSEE